MSYPQHRHSPPTPSALRPNADADSSSGSGSVFPASDPSYPSSSRPSTTNSNRHSNSQSLEHSQEIEFPSSSTAGASVDLSSPPGSRPGTGGAGGHGLGQGNAYAQQRLYDRSTPSTPRMREDAALLSPSASSPGPAQQQQSMMGMDFGQTRQQARSGSSPLGLTSSGTVSSQGSGNPFASRPASRSSSTNKFTTYAHPPNPTSNPTSPNAPLSPSSSGFPFSGTATPVGSGGPLSPAMSPQNHPQIIAGLGLGQGAHMSAFPTQGFGGVGGRASGSMVLYRLSGAPSEASAPSSGPVPPLPTMPTATSVLTASSSAAGSQHALLPPNRS